MKAKALYFTARLTTVLLKPLLVLLLTSVDRSLADTATIAFVASSLSMFLIQFDPHRLFYPQLIASNSLVGCRRPLFTYVHTLTFLIFVGGVSSAVLFFVKTQSVLGCIGVAFFFMNEKIYDELLRVSLFQKRYDHWGTLSLIRGFLFVLAASLSMFVSKLHFEFFIWTFSLISFCGFTFLFRKYVLRSLWIRKPIETIVVAFRNCNYLKVYWGASLSFLIVSSHDRLIVYLFENIEIADLFILITITSSISLIVEFFFTSFRRQEILKGELNDLVFLRSPSFLGNLGLGALACIGALIAIPLLGFENSYIAHYGLIAVLLFNQLVLAISAIIRDIFYWHKSKEKLLAIEFATSVCVVVSIFSTWISGSSLAIVFLFLGFILFARMSFFIWLLLGNTQAGVRGSLREQLA